MRSLFLQQNTHKNLLKEIQLSKIFYMYLYLHSLITSDLTIKFYLKPELWL